MKYKLSCIVLICLSLMPFGIIDILSSFPNEANASTRTSRGASKPVNVITRKAIELNNDYQYRVIGTAQAQKSIDIYSQVDGIVSEVFFTPNQLVSKGEHLLALESNEAQLAVQLAKVKLDDAQNLLRRFKQVIVNGGVTENELLNAENAVKAADIALKQAQLHLDKHIIKAPFSGYVGLSQVNIGDKIDQNTKITGLDDRRILFIEFDIPERLIGAYYKNSSNNNNYNNKQNNNVNDHKNIKDDDLAQEKQQDATLKLTTNAYPGKVFSAQINARESRINPQLRTQRVRANIQNQDRLLLPGMSFQVDWHIPGEPHAAIDEIALQWGREGAYIWLVKENIAHKVLVEVVARKAQMVLVRGDVTVGDEVVIEGLQRLREGAKVKTAGLENTAQDNINNE